MTFPAGDLLPGDDLFPAALPITLLASRRVSFPDSGVNFGVTDQNGTDWIIDTVQGWGSPATTAAWVQKSRAVGAYQSVPPFLQSRTVVLGGLVAALTAQNATDAEDQLIAAFTDDPSMMQVTEPGRGTRWALAARDGEVDTDWRDDLSFRWSAQVRCPDPRKFGDVLSASTGLPSTSGGLAFPFTFPVTFPSIVNSGTISLINPGNATGPVSIRVDGPGGGPQITHVGPDGVPEVFATPAELVAGQWVDIDMEAHTVLMNGTSPRPISRRGFSGFDPTLPDGTPGVNLWTCAMASPNPAARFTVSATPSWK